MVKEDMLKILKWIIVEIRITNYTDLTESRLDFNFNYLNKFLEDKEIDLSENALQSYNLSNDNFIDFINNYKFTYYEGRQFHSNYKICILHILKNLKHL